ncbi:predicted protein [Sclerotinia sclerotiorum 1980 UF-70]|uniref:Uncharacterized protein n=1 Tax=Sclerotinia sclerotiorum (strain ATCC 18683 / 1980 / Ss-1) TaxID=665079 RepID=A7ET83_SCLS1|nr:predicted protein [Sclerotinia sclerotiorum 1980 UF-70]EDN92675.1 predicted protein [Sclerotinia sclerotiorum 1980 UF-70]
MGQLVPPACFESREKEYEGYTNPHGPITISCRNFSSTLLALCHVSSVNRTGYSFIPRLNHETHSSRFTCASPWMVHEIAINSHGLEELLTGKLDATLLETFPFLNIHKSWKSPAED